jgi:hypothetical protein
MENDAERIAEEAYRWFTNEWRKYEHGYTFDFPGGPEGFLYAHVDRSIRESARKLNVTGGAVIWAMQKFRDKLTQWNDARRADLLAHRRRLGL